MTIASITDYRELARRRLPPLLFEYIDGGPYAEVTLRRNFADLEHKRGVRHVLELLAAEMKVATALAGATSIAAIGHDTLVQPQRQSDNKEEPG